MLKDIVEVKAIGGYRLWLRFENGVEGEIDCEPLISFTGVFAPLREVDYFAQVQVDSELGTIRWPNDADLDPVVLYALVTKQPVPDYGAENEPVGQGR
ncbi:MAG TPA: DUF2442 domain-containing protein [Candidatus Acidoferrales bacterium]|nr:DUF2442 domain-containing protein [Candidatus Acidoferrales bacterium]